MLDLIDRPLDAILSLEGLPDWVSQSLATVWHWLVAALVLAFGYGISLLVKAAVRWIGTRRLKRRQQSYSGSSWDLVDSALQAATFLAFVPVAFEVIGVRTRPYFEAYGGGVVAAFVILVLAVMLSRWLSSSIRSFGVKAQKAHRGDGTLFAFMASLVTYLVVAIAIILALTQIGVQTASLIALVGAAGLAIALALQDTLKAVASGVMLAIFRPYRIGDWVNVAGMEGEVTDITPFRTTIKPPTNQAVSLPNDQVWTNPISNSSRFARRRLDLYIDVSYEDDVDRVLVVMRDAVNGLPRALAKDETWVGVHAFRDWSVQVRCRVWVAMPEYVQMRSDCLRAVKAAFAAEGITIPYPHQVELVRTVEDVVAMRAAAPDRGESGVPGSGGAGEAEASGGE